MAQFMTHLRDVCHPRCARTHQLPASGNATTFHWLLVYFALLPLQFDSGQCSDPGQVIHTCYRAVQFGTGLRALMPNGWKGNRLLDSDITNITCELTSYRPGSAATPTLVYEYSTIPLGTLPI